MYNRIKKQVHVLLHPQQGNSRWDKIINGFLVTLILLNLAAVMLETEQEIYKRYASFFDAFDRFSVYVFTLEYLLRFWSANHERKYEHWFWGRLKYVFSWESLIDLAAIIPYYLHAIFVFDLRVLRLLRLARLLRIFRLTSYMRSTKMIADVFRNRFNELLLSLILTSSLIIIAACLMYFAEHNAQPDAFKSIPHTLYWSVVTLTTTGYGDMFPTRASANCLPESSCLPGSPCLHCRRVSLRQASSKNPGSIGATISSNAPIAGSPSTFTNTTQTTNP